MYSIIRALKVLFFLCIVDITIAQEVSLENNEFEAGIALAGDEATYYGVYSKFDIVLTPSKHGLKAGVGLTTYFDFTGESSRQAYLKKDVDMRIISYLYLGYDFLFNRFNISIELPLGVSIAVTKGTLVNEKIGFERAYSNTEYLWHYGIGLSTKYRINATNKIGFCGFYPLVKDFAWTAPLVGIGWSQMIKTQERK